MGKGKSSLRKHLQDEQIQAISAAQQHVDRWAGEERRDFSGPTFILYLALRSAQAATGFH